MLKIGISACFFHEDPQRAIFKGMTLQYIEQNVAHWLMQRDVLAFMVPSSDWWCYSFIEGEWGECDHSEGECEASRRGFAVSVGGCERWAGGTRDMCVEQTMAMHHIESCARQDKVACFTKHYVLRDANDIACAPTIKLCKARRANVLKNLTDDIRATSDCRPHD